MRLSNKESDLVRACLDWLALHRIKAWRMNNTGIFDPVKKVHRGFRGLRGVSDILGILPQTVWLAEGVEETFGNFLAIEVKRLGEKPRPEQETFLEDIRAAGGIALCVHSLRELEEQLRPFLQAGNPRTAG
ncbi:MAG TPA: VRR-NUC domain-containing protein [Gemmataceae bacterium]|nr:VRR-NUC domain-containing protein [Gemmataceae bacterium]